MPSRSSTTPLLAVDAVVLDTETTGLDTKTARIVQIGAIRIRDGVIDETERLEMLVDPGKPIPPLSTGIHNIDDAMVAGAPRFGEALAQLQSFVGDAIVIGHSIGYDLAIIKRQAKEEAVGWAPWRSLDVRLLAETTGLKLPDYSLDRLAEWLDIKITGRHSAMGDAIATGQIFLGIIPALREGGIRTLAEAEQACRKLTNVLEEHHRAGWVEPVASPAAIDAKRTFGRIDSYAYRHRVADVMSTPPLVMDRTLSVGAAIGEMMQKKVSSIFLKPDELPAGEPLMADDIGIITERDMMRTLAERGAEALDRQAGEAMTRPLLTIPADAYIYRAMGRMNRRRVRHLAVVDESGHLVGALSARDLLRLRATEAIALGDEIDVATDTPSLARAWSKLPMVARSLIDEEVDARAISGVISREIGALTRAAAVIAERRMVEAGQGEPPAAYAVLILGSGGRGESLLAADQDNAIIFETGEPDGGEDKWFAELGSHIADILHEVGVPYCQGGVMARNPQWRGSLETWFGRIDDWVRRLRPQDLLQVDIFYDLRAVHGQASLARALLVHAYEQGSKGPEFAKLMAEQLQNFQVPVSFFGGFKTDQGRLDLKRGGLFPIVAGARALAIRHNVLNRSTLDRLTALKAMDIGGDADLERITGAHAVVLRHMLSQQLDDLQAGLPPGNAVEIKRLSKPEQDRLKRALSDLSHIPDLVRDLLFR